MSRNRSRASTAVRAIIALVVLVCALVAAYIIGRNMENGGATTERGSLDGRFEEARVIEYDGQHYRYRHQDITTVLFMGVDTTEEGSNAGVGFRNGGQSDFLLLMVIDNRNKRITPVQIDRDTMTEITVLSVLGRPAGTTHAQICLSHGFGDGKAQSCGFTVNAVSNLLLGVDIDFYIAVNLDSISQINDALGGVTVTLEDDFSMLDPTMTPGTTLTLRGKQAEYYVRDRMNVRSTNAARMVRQRNYMTKLAELLDGKTTKNAEFIGELFDLLEPNLVTNMKRGRMINEVWNTRRYTRAETISPAGEHSVGSNGFVEFHADEAALAQLVLGLFFEPVT